MKILPKQYEYFNIKSIQSDFTIEFDTLKELARYAEKNAIKCIFILPENKDIPGKFAFSNKGGLMQHPTEGYLSLEEFKYADSNGFPDSAIYNEAMRLGFQKYDEYKMSTETGITDAKEYDEIKKAGYILAFSQFDTTRKENAESLQLEEITNAFEMREWVKDKKFDSIVEFSSALKNGFLSPLEYRDSITKRYTLYEDYINGITNGFINGEDYYKCKAKGIEDYAEMALCANLELITIANVTSDQKLVCVLISKVAAGKKTSINNLYELLNEEKKNYTKKSGELPTWFTVSINSIKDLIQFISTNEDITRYGHYDADGQFFQNKRIQERSVILDGGNVAYGVAGVVGKQPYIKNILIMVTFLLEKGFTDITVFTDAGLKHKFIDLELLPEVEKICKFQYTPAEKSADIFLLSFVKENRCFIISNDKFREWKVRDTWVANNIDDYRFPFMIQDEKVIMPNLDN